MPVPIGAGEADRDGTWEGLSKTGRHWEDARSISPPRLNARSISLAG